MTLRRNVRTWCSNVEDNNRKKASFKLNYCKRRSMVGIYYPIVNDVANKRGGEFIYMVQNLYASYASSEGKANRQGTDKGGRCQSWMMGEGRSSVWNQ